MTVWGQVTWVGSWWENEASPLAWLVFLGGIAAGVGLVVWLMARNR